MRNLPSPLRAFGLLTSLALLTVMAGADEPARAGWPPPPGADMTDKSNWPNDPGYAGQWNFWSWLPKQDPGTPAYVADDVKLGASGMSVDKAWTYTIGRSDVRIAVLDSGIEWDRGDLLKKAWLNAQELTGTKKPQAANGAACGGQGDLAGYDCDGDGIFTIADYAKDPRIAPMDPMGDRCFTDGDRTQLGPVRIVGDLNRNCALDAGDLIENKIFSDGVDDDKNGYTDDISGWDFFKNDNNPYDDTRYGHGSGEAEDSSAEGNNGQGDIGVCPLCRFVPLRTGESYIADGNDFAKAVVYAADNGIPVIGEALGGVNLSAYAKAAIDYAYGKGSIIVGSMADENSRHRNLPAATNHVLNVHAITYDGSGFTTSSSFLAFNKCTNYGGHNMLSLSGHSCSSEATGRGAGVSGLIFSMALSRTPQLHLSAEEVMQIFKMTADDIDIPESRSSDPSVAGRFYESRPGWDQRFGYGRVNVARAMQLVQDGTIPPEVDIVSPAWFDILYDDRGTTPVPIFGRIAASRASSYDWRVEWAAGVEPDETDWKPLAPPVNNVPASTTTGGKDAPLAYIDPGQIDTAHTPDPDSPRHENDKTITVRVHAIAHYGDVAVHGESRRTFAVVNRKNGRDPDLLPGFPMKLGSSVEASTKIADVDGDGVKDLVVGSSDGNLHVFTMRGGTPAELPGFPYRTNRIDGLDPMLGDPLVPSYLDAPAYKTGAAGVDPDLARETLVGAPGIADLDGDGKNEIAFVSWPGTIYVVDANGQAVAPWPKRLPVVPSCPLDTSKPKPSPCMDTLHGFHRGSASAAVLVDVDKDGKLEIVVSAFDGQIHAFRLDGSEIDGFPVLLHAPRATKENRIVSTPAAADFNGDGTLDFASGSNETVGGGGGAGPVFVVDGHGTKTANGPYLPNWPVVITSLNLIPVIAEGIDASPAAADFDGDGRPDVVMQGTGSYYVAQADPGVQGMFGDPPNLLPVQTLEDGTTHRGFDPSSQFGDDTKAMRPDTFFPALSHPSVGDLDQDGVPDLIVTGDSLSYAGGITAGGGTPRPFQHMIAMLNGKTGHMFKDSPVNTEDVTFLMNSAVADLDGDDYPEVMTGTGAYFLHGVNACGKEAAGWPKFTNGWIMSSPSVGDLDGDHKLEVVAATRDGYVFAWHAPGGRDDGVVQWESFHHDNQNTGDYGHPLDQGTLRKASAPLDCAVPPPPQAAQYDAGGCATSPRRSTSGIAWMALAGIAAAVARARRRRVTGCSRTEDRGRLAPCRTGDRTSPRWATSRRTA